MTLKVKDLLNSLNEFAPFWLAESWDNNGLLIGGTEQPVGSILVGLDPSNVLLAEAIERGCDTIITHHPIIFKPLPAINIDSPTGKFIKDALANSINVIACHTNLDSAVDGVSDSLGRALGLEDMHPIIENGGPLEKTGMGRIGKLPEATSGKNFLKTILDVLELQNIQVAGAIPAQVATVAICGGSGSEIAPKTKELGADIYITAEVKHSIARWAEEVDYCVVDGTHYSTEQFAVSLLMEKLAAVANKNNWHVNIFKTETEKHPFTSVDKN